MSYVLDALRKAEQDRAPKQNSSEANLENTDWNAPPEKNNRSYFPLKIFAGIVLLIVLFFLFGSLFINKNTANFEAEKELSNENSDGAITGSITDLDTAIKPDISTNTIVLGSPVSDFSQDFQELQEVDPVVPVNNLQSRIDTLEFEGSLFSPSNSNLSRIFISGDSYRIGDSIEDDLYIVDIQESIVVFSDGFDQIEHRIK